MIWIVFVFCWRQAGAYMIAATTKTSVSGVPQTRRGDSELAGIVNIVNACLRTPGGACPSHTKEKPQSHARHEFRRYRLRRGNRPKVGPRLQEV